jgi:hypothetical protein
MIAVPPFPRTISLSLGQAWRPVPEPGFRPATVHLSWEPGRLHIQAELIDDAIFTRATGFNQHLWELGDTFEMFLRPLPGEAYMEYHVAPGNHTLQLRFPGEKAIQSLRNGTSPVSVDFYLVPKKAFDSVTDVEKGRWLIRATIPDSAVKSGEKWKFSFSRYDAHPNASPIVSSTSAHKVLDFHDQSAWQTMIFTD